VSEYVPLLLTGHPRAGTGYAAAVCQNMGMDVGHESIGKDGTSSWMMGPPVWRVCFHRLLQHRGRNWYQFGKVIEIVREPLAHIASVAFTENTGGDDQRTSLWWRAMWCPINMDLDANPIQQAVQSIVYWHENMKVWHPQAQTVRIEDAIVMLPAILLRQPAPPDPGIINAREHPALTWNQVEDACGPNLWGTLGRYRKELGYL
jgi:hypothetical protein